MDKQLTFDDSPINIHVDENGIETVSARELWLKLESRQKFTDWARVRIGDYGFKKDKDFIVIHANTKNSNGGRPQVDYHMTIDMTKHVSMLERNEIGMSIRQWFIDRENMLRKMSVSNPPLLPNFNDPVAAARAWADAKEQELKARIELKEAEPKIDFYNHIGDSQGLHTVSEVAKMFGTGRNRFYERLRKSGYLRDNNEPYQKYIDAGYFVVKESPYNDRVNSQTSLLQKAFNIFRNDIIRRSKNGTCYTPCNSSFII